jgi:hypothetical protein
MVERKAWGLKSCFFFAIVICAGTGTVPSGGDATTVNYAGKDRFPLVTNAHDGWFPGTPLPALPPRISNLAGDEHWGNLRAM